MDKIHFFFLCAAVGATAGVIFWLFNFPLKGILSRGATPLPIGHPPPHEE
jgi:hypothetical protein